jgi:hypothetical protein
MSRKRSLGREPRQRYHGGGRRTRKRYSTEVRGEYCREQSARESVAPVILEVLSRAGGREGGASFTLEAGLELVLRY